MTRENLQKLAKNLVEEIEEVREIYKSDVEKETNYEKAVKRMSEFIRSVIPRSAEKLRNAIDATPSQLPVISEVPRPTAIPIIPEVVTRPSTGWPTRPSTRRPLVPSIQILPSLPFLPNGIQTPQIPNPIPLTPDGSPDDSDDRPGLELAGELNVNLPRRYSSLFSSVLNSFG